MEKQSQLGPIVRFGPFELDVRSGELQYNGRKDLLHEQPFQVLLALLERPGELVSREELIRRLWPDGTFVDYERGLNKAVNKLRDALRDSADSPRFIETIPRRGYRFIAPLEIESVHSSAGGTGVPSLEVPSSSGRVLVSEDQRNRFAIPVVLISILLVAIGFGLYERNRAFGPWLNLQSMRISRLTENAKAKVAAISPDGRYVVYVLREGEAQSLWMRQVAAEGAVQILAPDMVVFYGLTFSPDGNYIYFVRSDKSTFNLSHLYQMAVLGAAPRWVVRNIDTAITFSPDGKKIAFIRGAPAKGESYLVTANIDGSNEQTLATQKSPRSFTFADFDTDVVEGFVGPAWSPDGKTIVASTSEGLRGGNFAALAVSVSDGESRDIYSSKSFLGRLQWLPDGDGLLMVIADPASGLGGQIWHLSYPDGKVQRVTNDLTNYDLCCLDLTRSADTIATIEDNYVADLWLAPAGAAAKAQQITSNEAIADASWLTEDKILVQNTKGDLLIVDRNGANRTLLTPGAHNIRAAAACGDGRHIVFESLRSADNIWKMEANGSNQTQLTSGDGESFPVCSPDGQWVVYQSSDKSEGLALWRIAIDGGNPIRLTHQWAYKPRISPDGKLVSYIAFASEIQELNAIVVVDSTSGKRMYSWAIPAGFGEYHFAPDGTAIDYVITRDAVSNLWRQPLAGGTPKRITEFKSGRIFSFAWSRDGQQLLAARGDISSDVILIGNFR